MFDLNITPKLSVCLWHVNTRIRKERQIPPFADGHSELHRWRDGRTMPPLVDNGNVNDQYASPNNPDVAWLQDHATRPK